MRCALVPIAVGASRGPRRQARLSSARPRAQTRNDVRRRHRLRRGDRQIRERRPIQRQRRCIVDSDADLNGLSCRWQPLLTRNGVMLSAIIRATDQTSLLAGTYLDIYKQIQRVLARDACPVSVSNLQVRLAAARRKARTRLRPHLFEVYGQSLLAIISERTGMTIGGYQRARLQRRPPVAFRLSQVRRLAAHGDRLQPSRSRWNRSDSQGRPSRRI